MERRGLEELTARFCEAFNRDDLDAVMGYFAEDALYETFEGQRCRGKAEIRAAFEPQFRGDFGRIRFLTEDMVVDADAGKVVLRWRCQHEIAQVRGVKQAFYRGLYGRARGRIGWKRVRSRTRVRGPLPAWSCQAGTVAPRAGLEEPPSLGRRLLTMSRTASSSPRPPLLVWESGDLGSYEGTEAVERALEATDVKNGIYRAFDAAGRRLRLEVQEDREKVLHFFSVARDRVVVSLAEEEPSQREELREILVGYLESVGEARGEIARMSFDELVVAASRHSMIPDRPAWWLRR